MKPSEKIAKQLLQQIFPEMDIILHDTGKTPIAYDFKLIKKETSELFAAVEVTSTVEETHKKTIAIIEHNRVLPAKKLKRQWSLFINEKFGSLGKIRGKIKKFEQYLLPIEDAGVKSFFSPWDWVENQAIEKIWKDLKVEAGYSHRAQEPKIILTDAGGGGKMSHSYIQDEVKKEAFKTDNRTKLQKATDCERHLLIIVDCETDYLTWRAMLDGYCPPDIPNLPPEIDIVWLATCVPNKSYLIWRVSSANGWKILGEIDIGQKV